MQKHFMTFFTFLVVGFLSFQARALDWNEIEELKKTVVNLQVSNSKYFGNGRSGTLNGTGFVFDKVHGYILTNQHVASGYPSQIRVTFHDGSSVYAKQIYYDAWHDFAILQFNPKDTSFDVQEVAFGSYYDLKLGDEVLLIGNNETEEYSVKEGKVVQLIKNKGYRHSQTIQTSFDRTGGSSGSPVWNSQKKVVGLHFAGTPTTSFEMPIDYAIDKIQEFKTSQSFQRGDVGVILDFVTIEDAKKYQMFPEDPVVELKNQKQDIKYILRVERLIPNFESANILEPGDIIYKVAGHLVGDDMYKFDKWVDENLGKDIDIEFYRFGKKMTVKLPVHDIEKQKVNRFVLFAGGTWHDLDIATAQLWNVEKQAVYLSQAEPGSSASQIGVSDSRVGDRKAIFLKAINGVKINNLDDLIKVAGDLKDGDPVTIVYDDVYRFNIPDVETMTLNLKLTPFSVFQFNPKNHEWELQKTP